MANSKKVSAGLLMCRLDADGQPQVLLAHPGGPYFRNKDGGSWSLPKGLVDDGEDLLTAARREFAEEMGFEPSAARFLPLGSIRQKGGKVVHGWAFVGDCDPSQIQSNTFEMEWPPRSGHMQSFPEIDRAGFFGPKEARVLLIPAQLALLEELLRPETWARLFSDESVEPGLE